MNWLTPEADELKGRLVTEKIGPGIVPRYLVYYLGDSIVELEREERESLAEHFFPREASTSTEDESHRLGGALVPERIPESALFQLRVKDARAMPLAVEIRGMRCPLMEAMHVFYDGTTVKNVASIDFRNELPTTTLPAQLSQTARPSTRPA